MTDHDPPAADVEMFGQNAVDVASRIAAYIATNPDAANWSPQRWAYEAVMVILNDQGAAHDVLRCMVGQAAYDLAVIHVGSVPPWMRCAGAGTKAVLNEGSTSPFYVLSTEEADRD